MFEKLFPKGIDNAYRGSKIALWLFGLVVGMKITQSLAVIFNGNYTAKGADGIPLDTFTPAAAQTAVAIFAQASLWRLTFCLMCMLALVRYRSAIPLLFVLFVLNYLTGELIFRLLKVANWPITKRIADCLFTAVSTDTGSFQYPTTRPGTYHVAGELVRLGADIGKICDEVYQSYPLSRVRLLKHLYNHFRLTQENQIAWLWLKKADFARTGADTSDSEGLIDHIRAIEPVVVACVFEELQPDLTRVSLRSKSARVNVSEIAGQFGGGGHHAAAGARIPGKPMAVQRRVIAAIKKALNAGRS